MVKSGDGRDDDHASVTWRRLDLPGTDHASLARDGDGWRLAGVAAFIQSGRSCSLEYSISCDASWRTSGCTVRGRASDEAVVFELTRDDTGCWSRNGRALPLVDGCDDVDLGFTPATNTLPIRRLGLALGGRAAVRAAWVRFPGFNVEVLEQQYTRLAVDRYLYESAGGTFRRELTVDKRGFVLEYPGFWTTAADA
jgi:hypothetical protein